MKKKIIILLGLAALVVGGMMWYDRMYDVDPGYRDFERTKSHAVEACEVIIYDIPHNYLTSGIVKSNNFVVIHPKDSGLINKVHFEEGSFVKEGQTLITLEQEGLLAVLNKHRSDVKFKELEYQRALDLVRGNATARKEADKAKMELEIARAEVDKAQYDFNSTIIKAPFDGITSIPPTPIGRGTYVNPQTELLTVVDIKNLYVDISIPEGFIKYLYLGQPVMLVVDSLNGQQLKGEVEAIDPKVDLYTHALKVKVKIIETNQFLRPGVFVRANLLLENIKNSIIVPESCLIKEGQDEYVYRIVDGKAIKTLVVSGLKVFTQYAQVISGLFKGDVVISAGAAKLGKGDNTPVNIVAVYDSRDLPKRAKDNTKSRTESIVSADAYLFLENKFGDEGISSNMDSFKFDIKNYGNKIPVENLSLIEAASKKFEDAPLSEEELKEVNKKAKKSGGH